MRAIIPFSALALFALFEPASAQMMCGTAQQSQAQGVQGQYTPAQGGGTMCGAATAAVQDDPMADKPAQPQQRSSGMCACCGNMAMMRGGMGGMMGQQPTPQQR
jgi:hypothetical protein